MHVGNDKQYQAQLGYLLHAVFMKIKYNSCEIDNFVRTHILRAVCGIVLPIPGQVPIDT